MVQRSIANNTRRREKQNAWDCAIGFDRDALGGKNRRLYLVTDPNDYDAVNPRPGTLRHAVIQTEPLSLKKLQRRVIGCGCTKLSTM